MFCLVSSVCALPKEAVEFRVGQAIQATCCAVIVRHPGRLEASAAKWAACFFTPTDWDPDGKDWDGIEGREGSPIRIKKTMDTPKKRRFRATTADT